MSDLSELRELYPDYAGLPDAELISSVSGRTGVAPEKLARAYGAVRREQPEETGSDFVAGIGAGVDSMQATGYGLAAMVGDAAERATGYGEGLRDWGLQGYQSNMQEVSDTFRDDAYTFEGATSSLGNMVDAAQYWTGYAVPNLITAAVSGGVGGLATKALVKNASQRAVQFGATAAMGAQSVGQSTGSIYGQAVDEAAMRGEGPESVDLGRVAGYGLAAGALDLAGEAVTLGAVRLGPMANLMDIAKKGGAVQRGVTRGLATGSIEAGTEGVQTGLEDMGAGATADEARFMDPTSMMAGAFGGAPLGVVGGALSRPEGNGTELNGEQAAAVAAENARLEAEQLAEQKAAEVEALQVEDSVKDARLDYAGTFIPKSEFAKQAQKQREDDALNPATELGQGFRAWLKENEIYPATDKERTSALKEYLKVATPESAEVDVESAYLEALDAHATRVMELELSLNPQEQGELDLAPPKAPADGQLELPLGDAAQLTPVQRVAEIAASRGVELNAEQLVQLESEIEQIKQLDSIERTAAISATVAKYTATPTKAPAKPNAEAAPKPVKNTRKEQQRTYAVEQLGEDWQNEDKFPGIGSKLESGAIYKKGADGKTAFERAVDAAKNEMTPAAETTVADTAVTPATPAEATPSTLPATQDKPQVDLVAPEVIEKAKLSGKEQDVFRVLSEAFANNQEDTVLQADGKWNTAAIGKLAGTGEKTANTYVNRIMKKLAGAGGMTVEQAKGRLRDVAKANRTVEPARDINDPVEVFDNAELANGVGTKASANQGARDGMSAEDTAYLDDVVSEEPNPIADQRAAEARTRTLAADQAMVAKMETGLRTAWDNRRSDESPTYDDLSDADKVDWMRSVIEWVHSKESNKDATLADDQRSLERNTIPKVENQQDGNLEADAITVEATPQEDGATDGGTGSDRGGDDTVGAARTEAVAEPEAQTDNTPEVAGAAKAPTVEVKAKKKLVKPAAKAAAKPAPKQASGAQDWMAKSFEDLQQGRIREGDAPNKIEPVSNFDTFVKAESLPDDVEARVMEDDGDVRRVSISQLRTLQPFISEDNNADTLSPGKPKVAIIDGEMVVLDGNHRVNRAIGRGETDIEVRVTETNPPLSTEAVKPRFSVAEVEAEAAGTTATAIRNATKWLIGSEQKGQVIVVRRPEDLIGLVMAQQVPITGTQMNDILNAENPYGFVLPDSKGKPYAYFFTENMTPGNERAAVAHEIGSHIGMDNILSEEQLNKAQAQILTWAEAADGSKESDIAARALARVENAKKKKGLLGDTEAEIEAATRSEQIAYFIEEAILAGVDPTVNSDLPLHRFLHRLWQTFKRALSKFNASNDTPLFASDFVDVARGAAKLQFIKGNANPEAAPKFGVAEAAEQRSWVERNFGGEKTAQMLSDAKVIFKAPATATKNMTRFISDVAESMPSAKVWWDAMLAAQQTRREITGLVDEVVGRGRKLGAERKALVNDYIGASTFYQKWGYDPEWEGVKVKIDPTMKVKFNRLTAEEKQIVKDVFQHGRDMRQMMQDIAKELGVAKFFKFDSKLEGPYAPLKRFGNYVGLLKSQELVDAEREGDAKLVEKLKSDGDHYVVSFFDTMGAAQKFANANSDRFAVSEASERSVSIEEGRIGNSQVYEKIMGALKADANSGLDSEARKAVQNMIQDMYFESLDDSSARLSGARRLNRAGYDKDMLRSFAYHGRAQANLVSQMKHGAEINTALVSAQKEARSNNGALMPTYNVIAKKYRNILTPRKGVIHALEDNVLAFNTLYMLTSSLGYHVQNATQPLISVSKIAGDFGVSQYSKTWGSLIRGYKTANQVINTSFMRQVASVATMGFVNMNNEVSLDIDKAPREYRELLKTLQLRDLLDVGMEEDLNLDNKFDTGYEILNSVSKGYSTVTHRLYQAARFVEAQNRVSSAIAAYDVARSNPAQLRKMKMTAEEYAISVVNDTQGNFSQMDAPLLIDALPKVTTQFRKYQFMMAWLHADAIKKSYAGDTPEVKWAARRTLGFLVSHTALSAGVLAVPGANMAAWAFLALTSDGDEPDDPERWLHDNIKDERLSNLITRGAPAFLGLDMSQKLTQGDIFMPYNSKFVKPEGTSDGAKLFVLNLLAGPTASTIGNFGNIGDFLSRGDYSRAAEYMVPKGARSLIETYRYGEEGYRTRSGDMLSDPRNFDLWDLATNAIGLPSTEINKLKWTRGQQYELEQWFGNQSGQLRREYIEAYEARDRGRMRELKTEWRELQRAKDRVRPFFNGSNDVLKKQPVQNLIRATKDKGKREQKLQRQLGTE